MTNSQTVSIAYLEKLKGKKVIEAIFTTYTLDIHFFEAEVLWLLTGKYMDSFSPDDLVRRRQLSMYFQKNKLPVSLYFDKKVNKFNSNNQEIVTIPLSEYLLVPIDSGNSAFHPKISLILLEDIKDPDKQSLLYVSGSNNLTYNGWWENVEGLNMQLIEIVDNIPLLLKNTLKDTLEYLSKKRNLLLGEENNFQIISNFIDKLNIDNKIEEFAYSSLSLNNTISFQNFIEDHLLSKNNYDTLEIISPYFAEKPENVIALIKGISAPDCNIRLYLPIDKSNKIQTTRELVDFIGKSENIHWASFTKNLKESLHLSTVVMADGEEIETMREIHAKIFHWYSSKTEQSAYFVGSVNLSYKAFNENQEFGKLFFSQQNNTLLEELINIPELEFATDIETGNEGNDTEDYFKGLFLLYDWKENRLKYVTEDPGDYFLIEKEYEVNLVKIDEINIEHLEEILSVNTFLDIAYQKGNINVRNKIFVNQINLEYKEMDFAKLSTKEILEIYGRFKYDDTFNSGFIEQAIKKALEMKGIVSDTDVVSDNRKKKDYFSEYSEIFYNLRQLNYYIKNNDSKKDYFLNSKAVDSIPTLVNTTMTDSQMDFISRYITLLYIKQIYDKNRSSLEFIDEEIKKFKNNIDFKDLDEKFIKWFEKAFFLEFKKEEPND